LHWKALHPAFMARTAARTSRNVKNFERWYNIFFIFILYFNYNTHNFSRASEGLNNKATFAVGTLKYEYSASVLWSLAPRSGIERRFFWNLKFNKMF